MYHLFYQYNPHGALWDVGNLSWGHSVSGDLVNWAALDNALDPTAPFDANGCASGSVTILPDGVPVVMYSGIDARRRQVQNVAFPKNPRDPLLREWTKPGYNPVIPVPADVSPDNFRDPTTAWLGSDGLWRFAISAVADGVGATLVYRSADFLRWERNAAPLHASRDAVMAECPDLFPVAAHGEDGLDLDASAIGGAGAGVRHVLKVSMPDTLEDYYMVGRYDDADDTFTVPPEDLEAHGDDYRRWRRIDHGHLYASKTFYDAGKKRRVLWAWVNESDSEADDVTKGWSGLQVSAPVTINIYNGNAIATLCAQCSLARSCDLFYAVVSAGGVAGRGREAAGAVAGGGDRDAEAETRRSARRKRGGGGRAARDRRHRGLAGGRGGSVRDREPRGRRPPRPRPFA